MRLQDKVAIVTGAAGAIGAATARRFIAEGARVALVDFDETALRREFSNLDDKQVPMIFADLTTSEGNRAMAEHVQSRLGPVDVFFANAGIEGVSKPMTEYPDDVYDRVMDINVKGIFLGLKQVLPRMRDGGSVVLTSSIMGLAGAQRNIAYGASKHAVVGLMRAAASEAAPRRIRVNSVHPGLVESPMIRRLIAQHPDPAQSEAAFLARIKLGKFVEPSDIAEAVLFLSSDESRMITSQTLVIDGGMIA